MTDGEPETAVSASLQKIKSIKNQHFFFFIFYFIKSQTIDSFVDHFDGHFAYLKTLDFSFNMTLKTNDGFFFFFFFFFFYKVSEESPSLQGNEGTVEKSRVYSLLRHRPVVKE